MMYLITKLCLISAKKYYATLLSNICALAYLYIFGHGKNQIKILQFEEM